MNALSVDIEWYYPEMKAIYPKPQTQDTNIQQKREQSSKLNFNRNLVLNLDKNIKLDFQILVIWMNR